MATLVILQPGYLPWLGFFDQMWRADIFVYYDDVLFDKHGWRNRNRVKSITGPTWLTVPVKHKGLNSPRIMDIEIDNRQPWARKHLRTMEQLYARAPFLNEYFPDLEKTLNSHWQYLIDLNLTLASVMARWLGLNKTIYRSSELAISGERSERLLNHCRHFGVDRYLSGDAARTYLDVALFERHGIAVEWQEYKHPVYPQQNGDFVPYLSAIDLLFNVGPESQRIFTGRDA